MNLRDICGDPLGVRERVYLKKYKGFIMEALYTHHSLILGCTTPA